MAKMKKTNRQPIVHLAQHRNCFIPFRENTERNVCNDNYWPKPIESPAHDALLSGEYTPSPGEYRFKKMKMWYEYQWDNSTSK